MSDRAAWRLESLGFTRVYRYTPGKDGWLAMGLPSGRTRRRHPTRRRRGGSRFPNLRPA